MNLKYIISFLIIFCLTGAHAQKDKKKKKDYVDPYAEFKMELENYKKDCRVALKPYRYDGVKTTYFSYKSFEYLKEIEVATIQDAEYRLSFNANGIHHDKIQIKIYDKPETAKGRVLLYEKTGVGGNEFAFETTSMLEKLKQDKLDRGIEPEVVEQMRLKKIFIDYIIPAVERTTEVDEYGDEKVVQQRGAIILCVGFSNL